MDDCARPRTHRFWEVGPVWLEWARSSALFWGVETDVRLIAVHAIPNTHKLLGAEPEVRLMLVWATPNTPKLSNPT